MGSCQIQVLERILIVSRNQYLPSKQTMSQIHLCLQPKSEAEHLTNFMFRNFLYFVSPEVRAVCSQKEKNIFFPLFQISVRFHWGNHYRLNRTFWWDGLHYTKEQKRSFSVESYILYYSELRCSKTQ